MLYRRELAMNHWVSVLLMFNLITISAVQVESGKLVLEKAEFNLEAELTALIDVFSVQCDNKNLFISLDLAGISQSFRLIGVGCYYRT